MALTPSRLQIAFRNQEFVKNFFYYPTIASTNTRAKELAQGGAPEGTLVVADGQTGGQGRSGRHWFSPPELGLYVSVVFRPMVPAETAFGVHMAVSLGAADACQAVGLQSVVGIKWPNDVMAEGRKLAGVLSDVGFQGGLLEWCVAGIGINVNHTPHEFPPDIRDKAVSLRDLCHRKLNRVDLLTTLVETTAAWYRRFLDEGMEPLVGEWRRRSTIMGRIVRVETGGESYIGEAMGIEDDGALSIRLESGAIERLRAADVFLLQYR